MIMKGAIQQMVWQPARRPTDDRQPDEQGDHHVVDDVGDEDRAVRRPGHRNAVLGVVAAG